MFKNLHGFNSGAEMTENRIYGFADQKKKPEFLQPDNTKEKKNEEKPRNLWVSKKVLNICTLRAQEEKQKESEGERASRKRLEPT